ncbi:MAG: PAS domain S-box protein [Deltaproteobacteria bacterium]|nr:MAG: PAS domain S-box protein [Deltaproteobacteria bacterium]
MEHKKAVNVAIVGGGLGCKRIMELIFDERLSQLRMKVIGVSDINPEAVGYRYAQQKGIFTTRDYHDLYKLKGLDMIIELTGLEEVTREISRSKPEHIHLIDHLAAQLFLDIFQIEERHIADLRRAEEALIASQAQLRESEGKYRTIFDSTPNSIFILEHRSYSILDVNERALEIYGYEREELIGKSFMEFGANHYREGVLSCTDDKPSTLSSVYPKIRHYKKDGTPFYVNVYAIQSRRGRKFGIVAVTVDITESLAKESQLIQASKMSTLGEMASAVAHELNQPLSAMQIGADLIHNVVEQDGKGWDDMPEVSRHMKEQVDRAVNIINHLREFGRKAEIQKERVNINEPIKGVFTLLGQQLRLRGIKVVLDLKDDLPPIMGDANRLEQVFINLVVNARNAMDAKKGEFARGDVESILTVRSFQKNGSVVVTVTDTGIGIPDDLKDKIFEPFFTTREVGKGTGLGLSISYGIIKDYDGTIEVESELGKGATFKLTFPACDEGENGI